MRLTETTGEIKNKHLYHLCEGLCYVVTYLPEEEWLLVIDWV